MTLYSLVEYLGGDTVKRSQISIDHYSFTADDLNGILNPFRRDYGAAAIGGQARHRFSNGRGQLDFVALGFVVPRIFAEGLGHRGRLVHGGIRRVLRLGWNASTRQTPVQFAGGQKVNLRTMAGFFVFKSSLAN